MCFRKKKKIAADSSPKEENAALEVLAKDFSAMNHEDPVCAKKGDGTD